MSLSGTLSDATSASHQQLGQGASAGVAPTDPNSTGQAHEGTAAAATGTAAAGEAGQSGQQGMSGMPMGGMGGMRGGQGGGDAEHKSKFRVSGDIRDILGKPGKTAPPVIGEE